MNLDVANTYEGCSKRSNPGIISLQGLTFVSNNQYIVGLNTAPKGFYVNCWEKLEIF